MRVPDKGIKHDMRTTFNIYVLILLRRVLRYQRGIIGIRKTKSKKDRQQNDQNKKDKQNIAHTTKDRVTRIPIKAMHNLNYGVRQLYCQNNENINITHIIPDEYTSIMAAFSMEMVHIYI